MTTIVNEEKQTDPLMLVKKGYLTGFVGSIIVVILGLLVSSIINRFYPLQDLTILLLQAGSLIPGSTALFGVRGWDIQTWNGKTPAELLNKKIFIRLSVFSLFFPVMAFSFVPFKVSDPISEMESRILEKIRSEFLLEYKIKNSQFQPQKN